MLLSTTTGHLSHAFDDEQTIVNIAKAGFDAYDFSASSISRRADCITDTPEYMNFAKKIKSVADSCGLMCNQSHANFPPEKFDDDEFNKKRFEQIRREMEMSAYLGAPIIVVHASKPLPKEVDSWKHNIEFYNKLVPYCKEYGIKIGVENLFQWDEKRDRRAPCFCGTSELLAKFYDELDPTYFTVCFDTGHAAINCEEPDDAIRNLGSRIGCLHIHDNDYVNDEHLMPYMGKMDWDAITKALADVNYSGDFTFEACSTDSFFPTEMAEKYLVFLHDLGRFLIKKIESYKK